MYSEEVGDTDGLAVSPVDVGIAWGASVGSEEVRVQEGLPAVVDVTEGMSVGTELAGDAEGMPVDAGEVGIAWGVSVGSVLVGMAEWTLVGTELAGDISCGTSVGTADVGIA